ncbi:RICIN domain-containing protein [Streptomyces sp. NPDC090026]|uniref:RICIN domain-containing protein n=1 Tax=Streptomyces sp. NPDC090026 TaxID=3365923 RepID=UPI003817EDD6
MIRKATSALIALLTMVGVSFLAANPAQAAGRTHLWNMGNCATPQGNSTANGTVVTVWDCTGSDLQKWHWNGMFLVHDVSGKCLTPRGNASRTNGAVLTLWTCDFGSTSGSPQRFDTDFDQYSDRIRTLHGAKCITNKGNSLANGTWLTLWTCNPEWNYAQVWQISQ